MREWQAAGVDDVFGVDGPYIDAAHILISADRFTSSDLCGPLHLNRQFDLVESLEVAEHLPEHAADGFVDLLTSHGQRVLFSAATPGQGGDEHVNEQPLEYWRDKFTRRGFRTFDAVRPAIVNDKNVDFWYRHNTLLYIHASACADLPTALSAREIPSRTAIPSPDPLRSRIKAVARRILPNSVYEQIAHLEDRLASRGGRDGSA